MGNASGEGQWCVLCRHPWEKVSAAVLRKYPNSRNDRVESIDTRQAGVEGDGRLVLRRLMTTRWGVYDWVLRFAGIGRVARVDEWFLVDRARHSLVHVSRNVSSSPGAQSSSD